MKPIAYTLNCTLTGTPIGSIQLYPVAGVLPYIGLWKDSTLHHPLFAMPTGRLLAFARGEYQRLIKLSKDEEATLQEERTLQICFVAVLHTFGRIVQDAPALPPIEVVQQWMPRLFKLAYWKHYLDSKRFQFPEWRLNSVNANEKMQNVGYYIEACEDLRHEYETGKKSLAEEARLKATEEAMKKLRSTWIAPVGKKALWKWCYAHLSQTKYAQDASTWMQELFLASNRGILDWEEEKQQTLDAIKTLQDFILDACPGGNIIMHAVSERIEEMRKLVVDHVEAFTVDLGEWARPDLEELDPEPKKEDFASNIEFIRAKARWNLQKSAFEKRTKPNPPKVTKVQKLMEDASVEKDEDAPDPLDGIIYHRDADAGEF